ncbi:copper-binding protein [Bosea sp. (in: a-proteobacteria)]|uniref:copper-binding protein n=1 Tax=Bosea sp. (in: a-proteobacteria) TaxID=1871050 RepID=UPI0031FED550
MIDDPKSARLRRLSLYAGLFVASAPFIVGPSLAQGSQGKDAMKDMPGMSSAKPAGATSASAIGTVEAIDVKNRKIKLKHEPIAAFGWPSMSMEMTAAPSVDLAKVKPGSKVNFTLSKGANDTYTVDALSVQ